MTVSKLLTGKSSAAVLDFLLSQEKVASTPDGSAVFFTIEDLLECDEELPADLQDIIAEAHSMECSSVELYR